MRRQLCGGVEDQFEAWVEESSSSRASKSGRKGKPSCSFYNDATVTTNTSQHSTLPLQKAYHWQVYGRLLSGNRVHSSSISRIISKSVSRATEYGQSAARTRLIRDLDHNPENTISKIFDLKIWLARLNLWSRSQDLVDCSQQIWLLESWATRDLLDHRP